MIVLISEHSESEIILIWNVETIVEEEEAIFGEGPVGGGRRRKMNFGNGIGSVGGADVLMEVFNVDDVCATEGDGVEGSSSERC
jgi:hypothetical protein